MELRLLFRLLLEIKASKSFTCHVISTGELKLNELRLSSVNVDKLTFILVSPKRDIPMRTADSEKTKCGPPPSSSSSRAHRHALRLLFRLPPPWSRDAPTRPPRRVAPKSRRPEESRRRVRIVVTAHAELGTAASSTFIVHIDS